MRLRVFFLSLSFFAGLFLLVVICNMGGAVPVGTLLGVAVDVHATSAELAATCKIINKNAIGSVLIVGDIREVLPPDTDPRGSLAQWVQVVNTILSECHPRPLILADFENGPAMRLYGVPSLPRALTCGALIDENLIYEYGREIGRQCKLLGVDINLAPVLDVNVNRLNPVIHERSFGADPACVARAGSAYIRGHRASGVLTCAKHFPGHGDTVVDSHCGLPVINHTLARLHAVELMPFECVIHEGVSCFMSAHIITRALDEQYPATLSPKILTDVLRVEMGFKGLVISDALRMRALVNNYGFNDILVRAFNAGCDILLFPGDIERSLAVLKQACEEGTIDPIQVVQRAKKINQIKKDLSIERKPLLSESDIRQELETPEFFAFKQQLYDTAVTCVRDDGRLLPIKPGQTLALVSVGGQVHEKLLTQLRAAGISVQVFDFNGFTTDKTKLGQELVNFDLVLVLAYDIKKSDYTCYGIKPGVHELCKNLVENKKHIGVVIFGTPYSARVFDYMPSLLVAYDEDPCAQATVARILTGQLPAIGQLPIILGQ